MKSSTFPYQQSGKAAWVACVSYAIAIAIGSTVPGLYI